MTNTVKKSRVGDENQWELLAREVKETLQGKRHKSLLGRSKLTGWEGERMPGKGSCVCRL